MLGRWFVGVLVSLSLGCGSSGGGGTTIADSMSPDSASPDSASPDSASDGAGDASVEVDASSDDDSLAPGPDGTGDPDGGGTGAGVAEVTPKSLNFGVSGPGQTAARELQVVNTGAGALRITGFKLTGQPDFRFRYTEPGGSLVVAAPSDAAVTFSSPFVVQPDEAQVFQLSYAPQLPDEANGVLVLYTDDASGSHSVPLVANTQGACLAVTPSALAFGPVLIGTSDSLSVLLEACGSAAVMVSSVSLTSDSSSSFTVGFGSLPGGAPSAGAPLTITPGSKVPVTISYAPSQVAAVVGGAAEAEIARLVVTSDAVDSPTEVEISGIGSAVACPKAVGQIAEGEKVTPQTKLNLISSASVDAAAWQWSVVAPPGANTVFLPNDKVPNPTFKVDLAGTYQFTLEVWDENGAKSCTPWEGTVVVIADEAIRVELTWETPGDPNPADASGADLDLHFAHAAKAVNSGYDGDKDGKNDPWFDPQFDVFWMNVAPTWGPDPLTKADDPVLLEDNADGTGAEVVALGDPESGADYLIGVHVSKDGGFGESVATLRVYIDQDLVAEYSGVSLVSKDMWCVAKLSWPTGALTSCKPGQSGDDITPNYSGPF